MKAITIIAAVLFASLAFTQEAESKTEGNEGEPQPPCALGYCKGQKIDKLAEGENDTGVRYITVDHRAFSYGVVAYFTEETGVCSLRGLEVITSIYGGGAAHKGAYKHFRDRVAAKYGEYIELDYLHDGSVYDADYQWLDSLRAKERTLAATWHELAGSTLPDGLEGIKVDTTENFITVDYEFDNLDECNMVGEANQSDGF